jgi:hypothetical protein
MSIATLTAPDIIDQHVSSPDTNQTAQHLMVVIEDVTDRRKAEEKIFHTAHHDALTGLPAPIRSFLRPKKNTLSYLSSIRKMPDNH